MARTPNKSIIKKIKELDERERLKVLRYISKLRTKKKSRPKARQNDELIACLSTSRENLRAQQVIEWERTQRTSGRSVFLNN